MSFFDLLEGTTYAYIHTYCIFFFLLNLLRHFIFLFYKSIVLISRFPPGFFLSLSLSGRSRSPSPSHCRGRSRVGRPMTIACPPPRPRPPTWPLWPRPPTARWPRPVRPRPSRPPPGYPSTASRSS